MKTDWLRSLTAALLLAAPCLAFTQEPATGPVGDAPANIEAAGIPPMGRTTIVASAESLDLATGSATLYSASLAEPTSPSDSLNDPQAAIASTYSVPLAQAAPRDAFEERIGRLEAQVAELSRQLKSAGPSDSRYAPATAHVSRAIPLGMNPQPPVTAGRAVARYSVVPRAGHAAPVAISAPNAASNPAAQGGPVVIHIYVHAAPESGSASYRYSTVPGLAATAPLATQARAAQLAQPTQPVQPTQPPRPARALMFRYHAIPAIPGAAGAPAATPVQPSLPAAPPAAPSNPGASTPLQSTRLAWDDVPLEAAPLETPPLENTLPQ